MFDIFKDMEKLQDRIYLKKLEKKNDLNYELEYQTNIISSDEKQILEVISKEDRILIIFRDMYGLSDNEIHFIDIYLRVITNKGVVSPDPVLYAANHQDYINIVDIRIFGKNQNKGYGTMLISTVKEIAIKNNISKITGVISPVDDDHIDRLIHFYEKNGFTVNLDDGRIEWNAIYN